MLPSAVYSLKLLGLGGQLFGYIGGIKYGLQVHPLTLTLAPLLEHITHQLQGVVPFDDPLLEWLLER